MTVLTLGTAVSFMVTVLASFLLGERAFPFSTLGMFAYPYRPHVVVLVRDATDNSVVPITALMGATTSGLSQEVAVRIARGEPPQAIVDDLKGRLRVTPSQSGRLEFLMLNVAVDFRAQVHTEPIPVVAFDSES
jgi:hypothetical protein